MKTRSKDRKRKTFLVVIAAMVLVVMLMGSEAHAATYYLSTQGADSNSGNSSNSPWKTFSFAIPKLLPGDTLILVDGIYNGSNSGYPSIQCGVNAVNGTAQTPISIRAENERKAFLQGTGNEWVLFIRDCSYWSFHGLRLASADTNGSSQAQAIYALTSSHLSFQRLLVSHNNRYQNSALLILEYTDDSLIEESEFYSFHRHGVSASHGNNNTFRRNYVNSRNYADLSGGYPSDPKGSGDGGITVYPGSNNIVENNIIENTGVGLNIQAYGDSVANKYLGNIILNADYGVLMVARGSSLSRMPRDTFIENLVALNSKYYGFYFRANKNTQCENCMALDSQLGGFAADKPVSLGGDGSPTVFFQNSLAVNNSSYGFFVDSQEDFGVNFSNAFVHWKNFKTDDGSKLSNTSTIDPLLNSCKVFIPDSSPLKGAGESGSDIGANILYRYQDELLTTTPLWDPDTGEFPCGAQVSGVNDIAGTSCFDVHERLNVNVNGCSFPAAYSASEDTGPPLPPSGLQFLTQQ